MNRPNSKHASSSHQQIAGGVVGAALLAVLTLSEAPPAHAHPGRTANDGCHVHLETGECHCHQASADQPGCQGMEQTGMPPVREGYIRIASWNLNGLHWRTGNAIARWTPARTDEDYETLANYARRLNADVIAFQEVNGPHAAKRVFPPRDYSLFVSGRRGKYSDLRTGFAMRKGRFDPGGVEKRDYKEIGLGANSGLSWGVDLTVRWQGQPLRLLNVHLKAGCTNRNLRKPANGDCDKLARQIKPLKRWIDDRWREGTPFVVLGDFNREFDRYRERDHLWEDINDGEPEPPGLRLHRLPPPGRTRPCWRGTDLYYRHPVDFFVFGPRAWERVDAPSFRELTWDDKDEKPEHKLPSDHCPIAVDLF